MILASPLRTVNHIIERIRRWSVRLADVRPAQQHSEAIWERSEAIAPFSLRHKAWTPRIRLVDCPLFPDPGVSSGPARNIITRHLKLSARLDPGRSEGDIAALTQLMASTSDSTVPSSP